MNHESHALASLSGASNATAAASVTRPPAKWIIRLVLPASIVSMLLAILAWSAIDVLTPLTDVRTTPVVVKTVQGSGPIAGSASIQAPGWVEPDPFPTYVAALTDGIVETVDVLEGDKVRVGQTLATLVDDEARIALRRANAELRRKRSMVAQAQADLSAAELSLTHRIDATRNLAAAKASVRELDATLAGAHADIAVEEAKLEELLDEYQRKAQLLETEAVSEALVARLALRVNAQQAVLDATRAQLGVIEARRDRMVADRNAAELNLDLLIAETLAHERAIAAIETARADLELSEARVADAALVLERMNVRSPINGVVLKRLVSPGSKVVFNGIEYSAHVFHLYEPDKLQVRVDVPLADAAFIAMDQPAEIVVDVLPDVTLRGHVSRIVHEADIQKNTIEVKVAIDDPRDAIKPEMLARVRFLARQTSATSETNTERGDSTDTRETVFAPEASLEPTGNGQARAMVVVGRVAGRGKVEVRTVTIGQARMNGWVEILDGLQHGDIVISEPNPTLTPGDRVRVIENS